MLTAVALGLMLLPKPAHAWGAEGHQFIMERVVALLPGELRPFFEKYRTTLVEHVNDPDLWKNAGFDSQEDPNHFLDIDWNGFGPFPFAGLPRDYEAAVQKFGVDRVRQQGLLPWRTAEMHGNLRRAFEAYQSQGPFGRFNILHSAAWLAHYVSDANQPMHGVVNYNGQLTGQNGVHVRFEAMLLERYRERWQIAPPTIAPITAPRDFVFDSLIEGTKLVPVILKAYLDAIGTRDIYDAAYYEAFFTGARTVMEQRLARSISASAAMIAGAWEAAGRPPVPLTLPEPVQRRRR